MKFSLTTILSMVVGLAALVAGSATGFIAQHPDLSAVLVAVMNILGHFLPAAAGKPQP